MKTVLFFIISIACTFWGFSQDKRIFAEGTMSLAWNTTDVRNLSTMGLGYGVGYSFNYDYGRRFGFDVKFRYHEACWHGQDYEQTDLGFLGNDYTGALFDYKEELGFTVNNFSNDAREYGLEVAIHLNRLREEKRIDPYLFAGLSLVKNQAKGDLIHYVGLPKLYDYSSFDLTKDNREYVMDGTYESALDGSIYGNRIQLMPGLGIGCIYHLNNVIAIGFEHKTVFTFRDDFDGFDPGGGRDIRDNKDMFHYTGVVLRLQKQLKNQ